MKRSFLVLCTLFATSLPAWAADRTVTLDVPGMNCGMCPITVNKALKNVPGVKTSKADLDTKQAVVTYDDTKTTPEQLIKATTDAGYASSLKNSASPKRTAK
jgi:periplasmic mercuric ion binding protein